MLPPVSRIVAGRSCGVLRQRLIDQLDLSTITAPYEAERGCPHCRRDADQVLITTASASSSRRMPAPIAEDITFRYWRRNEQLRTYEDFVNFRLTAPPGTSTVCSWRAARRPTVATMAIESHRSRRTPEAQGDQLADRGQRHPPGQDPASCWRRPSQTRPMMRCMASISAATSCRQLQRRESSPVRGEARVGTAPTATAAAMGRRRDSRSHGAVPTSPIHQDEGFDGLVQARRTSQRVDDRQFISEQDHDPSDQRRTTTHADGRPPFATVGATPRSSSPMRVSSRRT